jgi:hypothetical protein
MCGIDKWSGSLREAGSGVRARVIHPGGAGRAGRGRQKATRPENDKNSDAARFWPTLGD